ncbi:MAG: hypothetical protein HOW73_49755 [Polyangiaceae bacterium]|nr:hypothetical protein [Polyangiaceae bacterium]
MTLHDPSYFERHDLSMWDRLIEALRRDWEQTKHDFAPESGHELNQSLADTLKQAIGREPIPPADHPNPRRVSARWVPDKR